MTGPVLQEPWMRCLLPDAATHLDSEGLRLRGAIGTQVVRLFQIRWPELYGRDPHKA